MNQKKPDYQEMYLPIEGKRHYLRHYPCAHRQGPVVLFLHGGPGLASSLYCSAFQGDLAQSCTMVYWDMPGAGRTLRENPGFFPTESQLLHALFILISCLKMQYQKQKIVLLGHGCGSILAALYAQKHPQDVLACIGVGPIIGTFENEQQAFRLLKEQLSQKERSLLETLAPYPDKEPKSMLKKLAKFRRLQRRYDPHSHKLLSFLQNTPGLLLSDLSSAYQGVRGNLPLWEFLLGHSLEREKHRFSCTLAAIVGGDDCHASNALASAYWDRVEAAQKIFLEIPQAGHYMMLDAPESFRFALRQILQSL